MLPFLLLSAIVPSMLLIWFFHSRDVYPEPQRVVWATFGLGVLTVIPVLIVELTIMAGLKHISNPFAGGILEGFFCAGMTEEFFKWLVVVFFCMRHREFDEPMDGIVYGAVASLGFATLENIMYVGSGTPGLAVLRALSAVPCHASMGAIMGYYVGQAKFIPARKTSLLLKSYFIPMLLHGAYDAPLLSGARVSAGHKPIPADTSAIVGLFVLVTLGTLIFEVVYAVVLSNRLRREQQRWHASRWAAFYAGQPPPPPPWGWPAQPPTPQAVSYQQPQPQQGYQAQTYQAAYQPYQGVPQQSYRVPYHHPQHAPTTFATAQPKGTAAGWLMIAFGVILATGGGFMTLGATVALAMGGGAAQGGQDVPAAALVFAGILFGLLPLVAGVILFAFGVRRLVRASPPPPPQAAYAMSSIP